MQWRYFLMILAIDDLCPQILKKELAMYLNFGQKIMNHALNGWTVQHETEKKAERRDRFIILTLFMINYEKMTATIHRHLFVNREARIDNSIFSASGVSVVKRAFHPESIFVLG